MVTLVWQSPCHESFLLHHIVGYETHIPASSKEAMSRLRTLWPDYEKGANATYLGSKISIDDLRRACVVEPGLSSFLEAIGYLPDVRSRKR